MKTRPDEQQYIYQAETKVLVRLDGTVEILFPYDDRDTLTFDKDGEDIYPNPPGGANAVKNAILAAIASGKIVGERP